MKSIRAKFVAAFRAIAKIKFDFTDLNGVQIRSVEEVYTKIVNVLASEEIGIVPITSIRYDKERGVVSACVQYIHEGEDELIQTVEHPILSELWGGGNITLCDKYALIMAFKIGTKEDMDLKSDSTTDSFEKITKKHGETKKEEIKPVIKMEDTRVYTNEEVVLPSPDPAPDPDETDLTSLVNTVAQTENLPEIIEEKKEEKKDPEVSDEKFNQVNEGWEVKVAREKCTDELTISKELDKAYTSQGVMVYSHPDMERCPIHPRRIIDKLDARPSTKKVRDMLVQFRAWGEDAFWANATSVLGKTKEELLQIYTNEKPKEEPKEEPVTQPKVTSLKLDFEISEVNGEHRKMEDAFAISQGLNQMGITKWIIMAAIEKMELPEIDKNASPDDVISSFINTQSAKKIEEMIIIAQKLG